MVAFLHFFLLRVPPETAHRIVICLLRLSQWCRFRVLRRKLPPAPALLRFPPSKLVFPGRVGLAAGFDKNAEAFAGLLSLGFAFVEVGTVTPIAQPGNPKPRIFRHRPDALVNSLGFNNCGHVEFRRNIDRYRRHLAGRPLLVNVGKGRATPEENAAADYAEGFRALAPVADAFVVNVSSPNTPGLVKLQTTKFLETVVAQLPKDVPAFLKFSPDLEDAELTELCRWVGGEARLAGVVLTNTSRRLAEGIGAEKGGLSGRPLAARSVECVALARAGVGAGKIVVGVGGIFDLPSARAMREAGADLVELYTGFIYRGPALVRELAELS